MLVKAGSFLSSLKSSVKIQTQQLSSLKTLGQSPMRQVKASSLVQSTSTVNITFSVKWWRMGVCLSNRYQRRKWWLTIWPNHFPHRLCRMLCPSTTWCMVLDEGGMLEIHVTYMYHLYHVFPSADTHLTPQTTLYHLSTLTISLGETYSTTDNIYTFQSDSWCMVLLLTKIFI